MVWYKKSKMKNVENIDYLDYSRIEVDMLEVEIDTWEEWCLPGFFKLSYGPGTSLCEKCTEKHGAFLAFQALLQNKSVQQKMHFFFQD